MNDATRRTLERWRDEIADEIKIAGAELAASEAALQTAEAAEVEEKSRVHELIAAFGRLSKDVALSNALRHRFQTASKHSPASATRGHAEAADAARFKLDDLHAGLDQVDLMLRPPAPPSLVVVDTRSAPVVAGYDPLIPARVA